jgi:ribosomal protein L18
MDLDFTKIMGRWLGLETCRQRVSRLAQNLISYCAGGSRSVIRCSNSTVYHQLLSVYGIHAVSAVSYHGDHLTDPGVESSTLVTALLNFDRARTASVDLHR